jgi:spectinomycin phosphotransferase
MRDEPKSLPAGSLAAALEIYWDIDVSNVEYAAVGFGSYHWVATQASGQKWFVTADNVGSQGKGSRETEVFANLQAAYATASTLRRSGLAFVVAPLPDRSQRLMRRIESDWAVAVFPYIDGHAIGNGAWSDTAACARAAGLVGQLHTSTPPGTPRRFSFAIPHRPRLFDNLEEPWTSGPYGERTRKLLSSSREGVKALLAHYDRLVQEVTYDDEPWVLTHGEPHSANFIDGADGSLYLIDWDTVRLAPAERDLAALLIDQSEVLSAYRSTAGPRVPRPAALQLFRVWWDVSEICYYVHHFRGPHDDSLDEQVRWPDLEGYLHVDSNWPNLREKRT